MDRTKLFSGNAADTGSNGKSGPAEAVQQNVSGLAHDLTELAELQGSLLLSDLGDFWTTSRVSSLLLIGGVVLAFSSVPVLLIGIGWAMTERFGLSQSAGLIGTAFVLGVLPAIALIWYGLKRFRSDVHALDRSRRELSRNLTWFKKAMQQKAGATARRS